MRVADDGLQLVTVELVERALRDGDGRFVGRMAGGKGVDALLLGKHVHLRLADARRDGHLLDDVQQPLALQIAVLRRHRHAAQRTCHHGAAGAQLRGLVPGGEQHRPDHDERGPHDDFRVLAQRVHRIADQADGHHQVDDQRHHQEREDEAHHQPTGVALLGFLAFEELRAHSPQIIAKSSVWSVRWRTPKNMQAAQVRPV